MRNDSLWERGVCDFNSAVLIWNGMGDDELYLNVIGFELQQCVEKVMKYILEENNVEYPKTHDIETLISLADENGVNLYVTDYIREHSEMLSAWETHTRYIMNYHVEYDKVRRALDAVKEYIDTVHSSELFVQEDSVKPSTRDEDEENGCPCNGYSYPHSRCTSETGETHNGRGDGDGFCL